MKYYAVRKGRTTGIFIDWQKCQESVKGFKGAEFKSFTDEVSAKNYLSESNRIQSMPDELTSDTLIAYTDGSYTPSFKAYGSGLVVLNHEGIILDTQVAVGNDPQAVTMNNVAGEIQASMMAMRWAINKGYPILVLNYDYEGIANWCTNAWKANKPMTQQYQAFYQDCRKKHKLKVYFNKVEAHTGNLLNELADRLAKLRVGLSTYESILEAKIQYTVAHYIEKNSDKHIYQCMDIVRITHIIQELISALSEHYDMQAELYSDICVDETMILISNSNGCRATLSIRFRGGTLSIGDISFLNRQGGAAL